MASPQKEKGHTPIANELLDKIITVPDISACSMAVIFWVARNTYGWSRKTTEYTWAQIARDLGRTFKWVRLSAKMLIAQDILLERDGQLGINKDYEKWRVKWGVGNPGTREPQTPSNRAYRPHRMGSTVPTTSYAREKQENKKQRGASAETATAIRANGWAPAPRDRYCPKCHVGHHPNNPCIIYPGKQK